MNIFDEYVAQTCGLLEECEPKRMFSDKSWQIEDKNTFLMERDTYVELGGYPKDSVNLIIASAKLKSLTKLEDGVYCIGDSDKLLKGGKHLSFGKVVLLETEGIPDDELYDFTQAQLFTDSRLRLKNVMLRQSPTHYNLNMRVGKKAVEEGIDLGIMGDTIYQRFMDMKYVRSVTVVLIIDESPLYKRLFGVAEKVKETTLTLNHIFDGIKMDCGSCDQSEICDEVEGLRTLHKRKAGLA